MGAGGPVAGCPAGGGAGQRRAGRPWADLGTPPLHHSSTHLPTHTRPPTRPHPPLQVRILKHLLAQESEADRLEMLAQAFEPGARAGGIEESAAARRRPDVGEQGAAGSG